MPCYPKESQKLLTFISIIVITATLHLVIVRSLSHAKRLNADLALFDDRLPKFIA